MGCCGAVGMPVNRDHTVFIPLTAAGSYPAPSAGDARTKPQALNRYGALP